MTGRARGLGMAGIGVMLLARLIAMFVPLLASATGATDYSWFMVSNLLTSLLNLGGIGMVVWAFLRNDAVAARFERGEALPQGPRFGPQDQFTVQQLSGAQPLSPGPQVQAPAAQPPVSPGQPAAQPYSPGAQSYGQPGGYPSASQPGYPPRGQ